MDNKKVVDEFNSLIEINNDRIEGYKKAIEETEDTGLQALFRKFRDTSGQCKTELVNEVIKIGGEPAEGTKTTGKLFRLFMDMKSALTGNDRKAILDLCEQGEDAAIDAYKDAIKTLNENDGGFLTTHKDLITSQYAKIKKDHDLVRSMRDTAEAVNS